jgi:hypothetical protein
MRSEAAEELLQTAARLVVDEGLDYGAAKRRAHKLLGGGSHAALPSHEALDDAVAEHLALFCGDTQPGELALLRAMALGWMERLHGQRPLLVGAVWRGTATRLSQIYIDLFPDDAKMVEIDLINQGVAYESEEATGQRGQVTLRLVVFEPVPAWGLQVPVHLALRDPVEERGSLLADARGRAVRGSLQAVRALVSAQGDAAIQRVELTRERLAPAMPSSYTKTRDALK